jgi:hypothetical protein
MPVLVDGQAVPVDEVMRVGAAGGLGRVDDALDEPVRIELQALDVVLDHQSLRLCSVAREPELGDVHGHAGPALVFVQQLGHRAAARREQELVDVDEGNPARLRPVCLEAMLVGAVLGLCRDRPVLQHDRPVLDVRAQHLQMRVGAEVVVEQEAFGAHQAVELDPFRQELRLVAVDGADREVAGLFLAARAPSRLAGMRRRRNARRADPGPGLPALHAGTRDPDQALHVDHVAHVNALLLQAALHELGERDFAAVLLAHHKSRRRALAEHGHQALVAGGADHRQPRGVEREVEQRAERQHELRRGADALDRPGSRRHRREGVETIGRRLLRGRDLDQCRPQRDLVQLRPALQPSVLGTVGERVGPDAEAAVEHGVDRRFQRATLGRCRQEAGQPLGDVEPVLALLGVEAGFGASMGREAKEPVPRLGGGGLVHLSSRGIASARTSPRSRSRTSPRSACA